MPLAKRPARRRSSALPSTAPLHFDIEQVGFSIRIGVAEELTPIGDRARHACHLRVAALLTDVVSELGCYPYVDVSSGRVHLELSEGESPDQIAHAAQGALEGAGFVACVHE